MLILVSVKIISDSRAYDATCVAEVVDVVEEEEEDYSGDTTETYTYYTPYVTYEVNGVRYENIKLDKGKNQIKIGEKIQICYDRTDPHNSAKANNPTIRFIVMIIADIAYIVFLWNAFKK